MIFITNNFSPLAFLSHSYIVSSAYSGTSKDTHLYLQWYQLQNSSLLLLMLQHSEMSLLYFPFCIFAWAVYATLSHFSRVRLCVTPQTAAHQAPPSLGFSRQEHWSGLAFPSPMHESEKWKWSRSVMSDFSRPHGLQPTRLLCPWDFPGKSTGVGCHCLLQNWLAWIK